MVKKQKPVTRNQDNLANVLKRRLSAYVFRIIRKIGSLAEDNGFSVYIVGGFVRDIFLSIENIDLDIVVEGDAITFVKLLKDKLKLTVVTHPRFSTTTVTLPNGFKIDIASARREHYPYAGCLPTITLSSIRDDLFRRDFTINTLAIVINKPRFGQLIDLFDGQKDLIEGKIRVLHDRSFIDDPTRIFRAIRFEQRFNFAIERHTERLIRQAIRKGMLKRLSKFRIGDEIILILKEEEPLKSLLRVFNLCKGLRFIHPVMKLDKTMIGQFESAKAVIGSFTKKLPRESVDSRLVYFMILTAKLNIEKIRRLCQAFSLPKKDVQRLEFLKKDSKIALKAIEKSRPLFSHQIYQILHPFSYEASLVLLCRARSKRGKNRIRLFLNKLCWIKIKLTGKDLKRLKLKPGPKYKDILQKVLYAKVDGRLKSKADETNYAKRFLKSSKPRTKNEDFVRGE